MRTTFLAVAAVVLLGAGAAADSPDPEGWSRFRGPNGSGISTSTHLPTEFGPDQNVIWKTELPFGHSSPALTRERIFLTAARGEKLVTICLDRGTGRIVWERDAPRTRTEKLDSRNGPAGPTPVTDGTNVYVFFADFGLISYDMSGRERWRLPLGPFNNLYGMGASPVLGDDIGVGVLVADEDDLVVDQYRRRAHAVKVVERPERQAPPLAPVHVIRQQAEVGEEHVDVGAVGRRRRPGGAVPRVELLDPGARRVTLPDNAPGGAIEADGDEFFAARGGDEDPLARQRGRRVAER